MSFTQRNLQRDEIFFQGVCILEIKGKVFKLVPQGSAPAGILSHIYPNESVSDKKNINPKTEFLAITKYFKLAVGRFGHSCWTCSESREHG